MWTSQNKHTSSSSFVCLLYALQHWFNLQSAHETCKICHCKHLVGLSCGNKTSTTQGMMCFVPRKQKRERLVWTLWFTRQKGKFRRKDNKAVWVTGELRSAERPSALRTKDGDKNKIMEEWDYCFCRSAQNLSPRICDSARGWTHIFSSERAWG